MDVELKKVSFDRNPSGVGLLLVTLAFLAMGVVMVHSALATVKPSENAWYANGDIRHTIFACVAAVTLMFAWRFKYVWLAGKKHWPVLAIIVLAVALLLTVAVYVPGLGFRVNGRLRWLRFGPPQFGIGFQPSEILKFALVVFLSAVLSRDWVNVKSFKTFALSVGLIGLCAISVIKEDVGTALIICIAGGAAIFIAGVRVWWLVSLGLGGAGGFWYMISSDPYRMQRIKAIMNVWDYSNPAADQPRQSLISIASSGWRGLGVGKGINKLGYLPEDSTDFIFASYTEEWGLIGAFLLMFLVLLWIFFVWWTVRGCRTRFGKMLAGSLGVLIAMQMLMHLGVGLVCLPPTGMNFPFISAGGTSLLIMTAAVSLIISVSSYKKDEYPQL